MTTNSPPSGTADRSAAAFDWDQPDLSHRSPSAEPFRHAILTDCLSAPVGEVILRWFENDAPWTAKRTDFYEQYEFSCWDSAAPAAQYLTSEKTLAVVRALMTELFGYGFEPSISVVCHKLVQGHRIGIHNDYLGGEETHRLTIQLNRGLLDEDGGFLMIFNSDDPADLYQVFRPQHLSALAFEISSDSYHAVSEMHGGERYTIIYSLEANYA